MEKFRSIRVGKHVLNYNAHRLLIALSFCSMSIFRFFEQIINRIPVIGYAGFLFQPTVYLALLLLSFPAIIKKIKAFDVFFIAAFFLALIFSPIIQPENEEFILKYFPNIILKMVPFYFLGLSVRLDEEFRKLLYSVSVVAILIAWAYNVYFYSSGRSFNSDEMGLSYVATVHVLIILWYTFDHVKPLSVIFSLVGLLYVFALGTRGPILVLLIFSAAMILYRSRHSKKFKILIAVIALVIFVFFINGQLFSSFLYWLRDIVKSLGYSTRIFDSVLLKETFVEPQESMDVRYELYDKLLNLLKQRPVIGYGLYGEYPHIQWSAHNMYLQTCFNFGYPVGIALILSFFILVFRSVKANFSKPLVVGFLLIWLSYMIGQSFFGGSIVSYYMFFTLGVLINALRSGKANSNDEDTVH